MKAAESEAKAICQLLKNQNENESEVIKAIMDLNHVVHSGTGFGGLSHREFITLEILAKCADVKKDSAGVNVSTLAMCLNLSMPQVSRLLGTMETKGYIERNISNKDRRSTYVSITDKGRLIRKCAKEECSAYMDSVASKMGEEKVNQLVSLLKEFTDIMKEENEIYKSKQ